MTDHKSMTIWRFHGDPVDGPGRKFPTPTTANLKAICDAAQKAWDKSGPRTRQVKFKWNGNPYVSTLTSFRMLVSAPDGKPVCCRYF